MGERIVHTVALPFGLAASLTGTNYCLGVDSIAMSSTRGYLMAWPGSVLAITSFVDLSAGSGSVFVLVKIGDVTVLTNTYTTASTNDQAATATAGRGAKKFVAGSLIQAQVAEVSSFTYSNVSGFIIVAFDRI